MAVMQMQRISICALKKDRKKVLELLQKLGIVQMDQLSEDGFETTDTSGQRANFERKAVHFDQAINILDMYVDEKKGLLDSLGGKAVIAKGDYEKAVADVERITGVSKVLARKQKEITYSRAKISKFENSIVSLKPWLGVDIPMNTRGTEKTELLAGTFPAGTTVESLEAKIAETDPDVKAYDINIISSDKDAVYATALCLKDQKDAFEKAIRLAGFVAVTSVSGKSPKQKTEELTKRIETLRAEIIKAEEDIVSYKGERLNLEIMSDYFRNRADKYEVLGTLPQSKSSFVISGYIPKGNADKCRKLLEETAECVVDIEDIKEGEEVPTALHNNAFSSNFEGITKSYGLPGKTDIDPTTIMSFFYVFFFGMMLSDVIYGALIVIVCFLMIAKKPNMDTGLKKSLRLFGFCGISTAFWGVMYGGYAGDAIPVIARTFFDKEITIPALWMEPFSNPMKLLMFCLLFGLIHLFTGLFIKGYQLAKEKDMTAVICDVVSWFLFLIGLILLLLPTTIFESIAGMKFNIPEPINKLALVLTFAGMLIILLMSGRRKKKNIPLRLALGIYDIYGVTSWLSDVLSYSRLLALGLATGVIAQVINMMASMIGGKSVLGVILFVAIMLIGHILNFGINLLGAYVHTNRLQYAEFFGKFYDAGGKDFQPFTTENKYIKVKEDLKS